MIYVHIPFCHRKCTYCAFYSTVTMGEKQTYVDALCSELVQRKAEMPGPVRTVYFGGGTPSILSIEQLGMIVDTIRSHYDIRGLEEVTIECNPEDLTSDFLRQLSDLHFFNRVSIGIQSFRDEDLRVLNRRHNSSQAVAAVKNAYSAGFKNISVDLIYGLPGQSESAWRQNLSVLEDLPISHLSAYSLTVEEGTMLHRQIEQGRVIPATDEMTLAHYDALLQWVGKHGFEQYEISNFCHPGMKSRHNSRYWDRTPYLGVGAAAHSFDGHSRRWNVADVKRYSETHAFEKEEIGSVDAFNEYIMTALRTTEGISKSMIVSPFDTYLQKETVRFVRNGLLEDTGSHFRPTHEGLLHADGIAAELFYLQAQGKKL